jgi:hypothetical protein
VIEEPRRERSRRGERFPPSYPTWKGTANGKPAARHAQARPGTHGTAPPPAICGAARSLIRPGFPGTFCSFSLIFSFRLSLSRPAPNVRKISCRILPNFEKMAKSKGHRWGKARSPGAASFAGNRAQDHRIRGRAVRRAAGKEPALKAC